MPILPEAFHPRIGLASIELADESPTPLLPEDSFLQPIDAAMERKLEELLQAQTFEKMTLDALRPQVQDRSILQPSVFHPLRAEVLSKLEAALASEKDANVVQELRAAVDLLQHLGVVHDLGEQYRYALLKG